MTESWMESLEDRRRGRKLTASRIDDDLAWCPIVNVQTNEREPRAAMLVCRYIGGEEWLLALRPSRR